MPDMPRAHHLPVPAAEDSVLIAAEEIRVNDVFDFAGATLRALAINRYEDSHLIEIEAVGPFAGTTVHYLPFEAVRVFLPRAEELA